MTSYTYLQIASILATRAPMLMLDRAEISEDGISAVGRKAVSMGEALFQGHFPGQPILPGVLQVAAMAQLSKLLFVKAIPGMGGTEIVLKHVRRVKFRKPVLPGMIMTVEAKLLGRNAEGEAEFQVSCTTEEGLASAGVLVLARINPEEYNAPRGVLPSGDWPYAEECKDLPQMDAAGLMKLLPHRPPFLLVDRGIGVGVQGATRVYGWKNISGNDQLLLGKDGGVFSSALMLESAAQIGCAHILSQPEYAGKLGIYLCVDQADFLHHAVFGDRLKMMIQCELSGRAGAASGDFWVDDMKIGNFAIKFIFVEAQH